MNRLILAAGAVWSVLVASPAWAQIPPPPAASPPGIVRVAGPATMAPLVRRWAADFERANPGIRVELLLRGSDVAMAELYTGHADVALLGREATEPEAKAFEWIFLYPPSRTAVLTGSRSRPSRSPALAILVHPDNPLRQLTMAQLASVFGADPSVAHRIRTWGDLGLDGEWRDRAIKLYGPEAESGTGRFFRATVLGGSNKMNWDALTEFADPVGPEPDQSGRKAAAAVARDASGLGVGLVDSSEAVRVLALAPAAGGPPVTPTRQTLATGDYPLTRRVHAYFNQKPGTERDAETDAFLRHIGGEAGVRALRPEDDYLPIEARP